MIIGKKIRCNLKKIVEMFFKIKNIKKIKKELKKKKFKVW